MALIRALNGESTDAARFLEAYLVARRGHAGRQRVASGDGAGGA